MPWKKSNDGGLDYDVKLETEYEKAKEKMFNPCGTAHTMTFNFGFDPIPPPLSRKEQIKENFKRLRRAKIR